MLRDAYVHGQFIQQALRTRVAPRRGRLDERAMADLAPGPRLLAVVVQVHARHGQQRRARAAGGR